MTTTTEQRIELLDRVITTWEKFCQTKRVEIAAKLADDSWIYSSVAEDVVLIAARENVIRPVRAQLEELTDEGVHESDEFIVKRIADNALRSALDDHHINSTSNTSVEVDTYTREYWSRVASIATGLSIW